MSEKDDEPLGERPMQNAPEPVAEFEEVDAVPVPEEPQRERLPALLSRPLAELRATPGVQAAAVAAGGLLAGAAVVGLARRR
ncbi:MAG: hypothetical protein ACYCYN_11725, partial [Solirubrobacteraceae bacterium]